VAGCSRRRKRLIVSPSSGWTTHANHESITNDFVDNIR
jgi:hypothetical protein